MHCNVRTLKNTPKRAMSTSNFEASQRPEKYVQNLKSRIEKTKRCCSGWLKNADGAEKQARSVDLFVKRHEAKKGFRRQRRFNSRSLKSLNGPFRLVNHARFRVLCKPPARAIC